MTSYFLVTLVISGLIERPNTEFMSMCACTKYVENSGSMMTSASGICEKRFDEQYKCSAIVPSRPFWGERPQIVTNCKD